MADAVIRTIIQLRADYVATSTITMFGRYSGTHEGDSTPGAVPGRATIGTALPQNGVYGMTWSSVRYAGE